MSKTNAIFFGVITLMLTLLGFFAGSVVESNASTFERNRLIDSIDIKQAVIDHYESNADYNATFSLEAKGASTNCNKCGPLLTAIQFRLDSIKQWKGQLVVPEKYPELK